MLKKVLDVISAANTLTLPMDTRAIADHFDFRVLYYSHAKELIEELQLTENATKYPAFCAKGFSRYYIFLSDDLTGDQERQATAHELGHVLLGHLEEGSTVGKEETEEQANEFELLLMAPPPLLQPYCDIHDMPPRAIAALTGLSMADSRRAYQLLEDYRRDQQEAARREDIANRARLAMQPPAPVDIPALFSRPEVSVYIHQLLAATVPQLEKAVG